jgi:hypothetical protein
MKTQRIALLSLLLLTCVAEQPLAAAGVPPPAKKRSARQPAGEAQNAPFDQLLDRIVARERQTLESLSNYSPRIETYIQNLALDPELGTVPVGDHYFLGRLDIANRIRRQNLLPMPSVARRVANRVVEGFKGLYSVRFTPKAFAALVIDTESFDLEHYQFEFVRREFLGDVRCLVFDVKPRRGGGIGLFEGRIWVEDQDYNIVRFNGTYAPDITYWFHFDSWRQNLQPGLWLPVYIYSEESDLKYVAGRPVRFKSATRLWGYASKSSAREEELTRVLVDAPEPVRDVSEASEDPSPILSQRQWLSQAEENVLLRLEKASLVAPPGEVDKVLETVVSNLMVTNHLDNLPPIHCRVLLTYPLESLTVGNTIVLSRGLIDVLPDEASLAMVLAHELAHIALGHALDTKYAFNDRMLLRDEDILRRFDLKHSEQDEEGADGKAIEFLRNSPYKGKLGDAGLFLRAATKQAGHTPNLFGPRLGNRFLPGRETRPILQLMNVAPQLQRNRLDQIPALPLGARVKVDPWSDRAELARTKPVALIWAREKMPFQVTPLFLYLTRLSSPQPNLSSQQLHSPQ